MWSYRAFDTLAKALNPGESAACQNSESIDGNAQLLGGETSMNIVEIEGPLLSDAHVAFRVLNTSLLLTVYNYFDIMIYNKDLNFILNFLEVYLFRYWHSFPINELLLFTG